MDKQLMKNTLVWGFVLWLIGYILGIFLFILVPSSLIGWIISPIGIAMTIWVLFKKIKSTKRTDYWITGTVWLFIAVALDYFLLVKLFKPEDGYYKLDVYIYYAVTFLLPIIIGKIKSIQKN